MASADRAAGGVDISRNGGLYAELAELTARPELTERFTAHLLSAAAQTVHRNSDYGELPVSLTQPDAGFADRLCAKSAVAELSTTRHRVYV